MRTSLTGVEGDLGFFVLLVEMSVLLFCGCYCLHLVDGFLHRDERNFKALIQEGKDVLKLKRWRNALVLALMMITLGNGMLLARMRDLRETHTESLQVMNTAYQNLLHDYENASEDSYACLKEIRAQQTQNPEQSD